MLSAARNLAAPAVVTRAVAVVAALALLVTLAAWPTVDAHVRAGSLLASVVLGLPVEPVAWVTHEPVEERFDWAGGGTGRLTLPGDGGTHPVLLMVLGADPAGPDDSRVVRLREGLARVGIGSLVARSTSLIDGRVTPDEVAQVLGAFRALERDPRVTASRVGLLGLSTGGALVMVAATDPVVADRVWCVVSIGAYHDAATLTAQIASQHVRTASGEVPWTPDPTARRVARLTLLAALAPDAPNGAANPTVVVDGLMASPGLAEAEAALASLGATFHARMEAISPRAHLAGLRAPLYLLHDRGDRFIPATHAEAITVQHPPRIGYLVDIFAHVEPRLTDMGALPRDGWRVLNLFAAVIESR